MALFAVAPRPPPSLEVVFTEEAPFVLRVVRRMGVAPEDVEDVAQNVFLVVQRRLPEFSGESVRPWLFAIARRVVADHRKRAHRRREVAEPALLESAVPPAQEEHLARREARALLERAIARLDEDKRDVFTLFELEEMPMVEVASAVGCPLKTAYARLYAARRIVRDQVNAIRVKEPA